MEEPPEAVCKISSEEFVAEVREKWEFDWGLAVAVFELIDRLPGIRSGGRYSRQKKPRVEKHMQIICYDVNLELVLFEGAAGDKDLG